jgi:hypothetical protein
MGRIEKGGSTIILGTSSQEKAETLGGWQKSDRRRHEEAMGCGESGETSSKEGTSEVEDVTGTEGCTRGESGESTSGQGSKAGGSGVTEISRYEADHSQEGGTSKGCDEEPARKESGGKEEGSEEVGGEENLPAAAQSVTEKGGQ